MQFPIGMIKWGMEILSPGSYLHNPNWFLDEYTSANWTHDENKLFENALAIYDNDTADRWHKVAAMIPGKTVVDVLMHYKELEDDVSDIEAGLIPIPGYSTNSFTLDLANNRGFDGYRQYCGAGLKRPSSARNPDQERKKGVPWTEDEHRQFLMGLKKYGKGDWRNISRNFVVTRTPTQVASHAQKYFIRLSSGGKDKRRSSIHDITTVNLTDNRPPSPPQSAALPSRQSSTEDLSLLFNVKQPKEERAMVFSTTTSQTHGNLFMPPPYGMTSYGLKFPTHNLHRGAPHESQIRPPNTVFQIQSSHGHLLR